MKRVVILFFIFVFVNVSVYAEDHVVDNILTSAESLFKSMKEKNYTQIWELLTTKSKNTIVEDVYKKDKEKISKKEIYKDFDTGGPIAQAYWDGFIANFNPDTVLEHSRWKMGPIKSDRAEIIIIYKKSENPADLKMFKEDGSWKVGLVETFWSRY